MHGLSGHTLTFTPLQKEEKGRGIMAISWPFPKASPAMVAARYDTDNSGAL